MGVRGKRGKNGMLKLNVFIVRHAKMINYQEQIKPFVPTISELAEIWNCSRTTAFHTVNQLANIGYVETRERCGYFQYYARPINSES